MATSFTKIVVIYFCINALLFVGGIRVLGGDNFDYLDNFVNVNQTEAGQVAVADEMTDTLPSTLEESGTVSQTLQFVDSIGAIKRLIGFLINIVFTPLGLFTSAGLAWQPVLIIGVPIMLMLFMGVAYFIRSGT